MLVLSLAALVLAAEPATTHRVLILGGGKTEAEALPFVEKGKALASLIAKDFPKVVKSDDVPGMKPGFVVTVLGACAKDDVAGLLALERVRRQTRYESATFDTKPYYRDVVWKDAAACPKPIAQVVPLANGAGLKASMLMIASDPAIVAVTTPEGAQVLDDVPVVKLSGSGTLYCSFAYGTKPLGTDAGIDLTWSCTSRGGSGCSSPPTQEILETVTVTGGKLDRKLTKGKVTAGQCD